MKQGLLPLTDPLISSRKSRLKKPETELSEYNIGQDEWSRELADGVLDAYQIKINHLYDKLGCLSNSRTRLLPHQIEATHTVVNSLRPRFLIADEVGLGKTIEAGLIIKELMLRKGLKRVLIILPAPLGIQWQQEMRSKFNEDFTILNSKNFEKIAGNWKDNKKLITSIDFIKNPFYAEQILKIYWDIVIFDEAHRLRRDYSKVTKAYAFADQMAQNCDALLLLSATPFRGKLEELYYLIRLVDPHLLGPYHSFLQEYVMPERDGEAPGSKLAGLKTRIERVMLRRRKVDVGGFTKRHACTIRFELSPEERALYDETTNYVKQEYNLAQRENNKAVSFIMIVFQKLLDSSTQALLGSLERRKTMLEKRMFTWSAMATDEVVGDEFDLEDLLDDAENPDELLDSFQDEVTASMKDLRKEVMTVSWLIKLARKVKKDRKLIKLTETMARLRSEGSDKFIIFTQFRTTQAYLAEKLSADYSVTVFHGSLNWREKEEAIEEFRDKTEVLILTEAGGEGRNLQFTNILFNYDLPWSPLKIEQRIGRIHRFGQDKDVYIFNFATIDTVAERILEILERKINLFSETIGTPDILLGSLEDENMFQKNFMKFISGQKSQLELDAEIEAKAKIAKSGYQKLNDLVTPHCVDFNLNDYYSYSNKNRKIDNDRIEKITRKYLFMNPDAPWKLYPSIELEENMPAFSHPQNTADFMLENKVTQSNFQATFQSESALNNPKFEFLALGHPLVEEALRFFLNHKYKHQILPVDQVGHFHEGFYFIFVCELKNGMERSELMSCHVSRTKKCTAFENELHKPIYHSSSLSQPHPNADLEVKHALEVARNGVGEMASNRASSLKDELHSIFKKEEYKLEISFGKKMRNLEEKQGRQAMRLRLNSTPNNKALLTRTENEIKRSKQELEQKLYKIRQESGVQPHLTLLQAYVIL